MKLTPEQEAQLRRGVRLLDVRGGPHDKDFVKFAVSNAKWILHMDDSEFNGHYNLICIDEHEQIQNDMKIRAQQLNHEQEK